MVDGLFDMQQFPLKSTHTARRDRTPPGIFSNIRVSNDPYQSKVKPRTENYGTHQAVADARMSPAAARVRADFEIQPSVTAEHMASRMKS